MNHDWIKARICESINSTIAIRYQEIVDQFASDLFDDVIDVLTDMYIQNHIRSSCGQVYFRSTGHHHAPGHHDMRQVILSWVNKVKPVS